MMTAIASGKGGTGKTTVSAALASVWPRPVIAVDLDVEEPNLHLFLKPMMGEKEKAFLQVPVVDENKCNYCRACTELCQFKAISVLGSVLMIFSEMCHGCGGCLAICPEGALSPGRRELGTILQGTFGNNTFLMGRSRVGEAMSPPLMRAVKQKLPAMVQANAADVLVDAPPGVSCPAVNAVLDADVIVLVTEPTPFGLFDLQLAHEAFLPLGKPMGVVINRAGLGDTKVHDFCHTNNLPVWLEIPYDRDIAAAYAKGRVVTTLTGKLKEAFASLAVKITQAGVPAKAVCDG